MAKRVITFGEIMMRLNPIGYLRLVQSDRFEATYAGGEANVAVSLANYGLDAAYVTKVPAHEVGQCAVNELRRYGVDTQYMVRGGDRLGIYFCEKGASQRASKVIYDRASSAIALAKRTDFDWDTIFDGADWFHWTGITPALGGELPEICLDACKAAKARGLTISCDLNFRKKLWTSQRAGEVMSQLLPYVDVCIANEEDAKDVFGIEAEGTDINSGKLNRDGYISVARQLSSRFGCKYVAITLRSSISANDNDWAGMLYEAAADKAYFSTTYHVHIVDRVGGGDSFGGGLIYSMLSGYDAQQTIDFAVAASCLKHSIEHDFNHVSVAEVAALAAGNASGRVQRGVQVCCDLSFLSISHMEKGPISFCWPGFSCFSEGALCIHAYTEAAGHGLPLGRFAASNSVHSHGRQEPAFGVFPSVVGRITGVIRRCRIGHALAKRCAQPVAAPECKRKLFCPAGAPREELVGSAVTHST